jgi:hypothetical protein
MRMWVTAAILGVWLAAFAILLFPGRWVGRWIARQTKSTFWGLVFCVVLAKLVVVWIAVFLVFARLPFLAHVNSDPQGFGLVFVSVLFFVPALLTLVLGFRRARSSGVEPPPRASPIAVPPEQTGVVLRFIRSTIPLPLLYAIIGLAAFGMIDILSGKLVSQFISDARVAALSSSFAGALVGYLLGWHIVRTNGLPVSATPYEVIAAERAKQENAARH